MSTWQNLCAWWRFDASGTVHNVYPVPPSSALPAVAPKPPTAISNPVPFGSDYGVHATTPITAMGVIGYHLFHSGADATVKVHLQHKWGGMVGGVSKYDDVWYDPATREISWEVPDPNWYTNPSLPNVKGSHVLADDLLAVGDFWVIEALTATEPTGPGTVGFVLPNAIYVNGEAMPASFPNLSEWTFSQDFHLIECFQIRALDDDFGAPDHSGANLSPALATNVRAWGGGKDPSPMLPGVPLLTDNQYVFTYDSAQSKFVYSPPQVYDAATSTWHNAELNVYDAGTSAWVK